MAVYAPQLSDYEHITVRQVGGNIGAELGGVQASGELAGEVVRELRRALLRHRVVFLRGQEIDTDDASSRSRACSALPRSRTRPSPATAAACCRSTPSRARPTAGTPM